MVLIQHMALRNSLWGKKLFMKLFLNYRNSLIIKMKMKKWRSIVARGVLWEMY